MKVTFITTINYNVGDDFVREGIKYLIRQSFGEFRENLIHKHIPVTVRFEFDWVYSSGLTNLLDKVKKRSGLHLSQLLDFFPSFNKSDKIYNCDILVQSGAPVFWYFPNDKESYKNEWYEPLIKKRYLKIRNRSPLLNIGAGSCLPYYSNGSEFQNDVKCVNYLKEFVSNFTLTTVRDKHTQKILKNLGFDVPVIPCPSIFARDEFSTLSNSPEYIALNYMPGGGHYYLGQSISTEKWEKTFIDFYNSIKGKYPVVIVCHNKNELKAVKKILPLAKIFFERGTINYLDFYSKAKFYIGCRVHGAFATASFGRPAYVIGNDTRALMTEELGLESSFVEEIDLDKLHNIYEKLNYDRNNYGFIFNKIRNEALKNYINILKSNIKF